jgi:hypothetical protein
MNFLRVLSREREKPKTQADVLARLDDDVRSMVTRGRFMGEDLAFGPNFVHAAIFRADGEIEDLGWTKNLKTTAGMDWLHNAMFGSLAAVGSIGSPATNVTATAVTVTGTPLTSSAHIGQRIVMPVTNITTAPVYGNVLSNTTSVLQIDQWWTSADGTGTTPASTNAFLIEAGMAPARFVALTTDTSGPAVGDTSLTSEITTNGLQRALGTYAHTPGATTSTITKTWTASGTHTAVHKAGLLTGGYGASGGGVLVAATNLNADATLASGDSLQVTWTWTLPAAG